MSVISVYFEGNRYVIDKEKFQNDSNYTLINDTIKLPSNLDDCVSLNDSTVKKFINYFDNKLLLITIHDVVAFDLLADMFQVKTLKKFTNDYKQNNSLRIAKGFFENYNGNVNTIYEELIAKNLLHFLTEPKLLQFSISSIYRIIQEYLQEYSNNMQVVNFMFRFFEVNGTESSVIFGLVERLDDNEEEDYFLNALYLNYKDTFNFSFLQSSHFYFLFESYMEISVKYHSVKMDYDELVNILFRLSKERMKKEEPENIDENSDDS